MDKVSWKNSKVLVTGADGFIGSHVAKALVEKGSKVATIVRDIKKEVKINYSDFSQFNKVSEQVSQVIFFAAILILPTIMIFLYLILFLKYLFIALSLSFLFYILLDLAFFQTKFKRIFTTALYSTILFIPVELIFIGINEEYLIPIQDFYKIKIYLLTSLIYLIFFLINSIVVGYYVKKLSQEW